MNDQHTIIDMSGWPFNPNFQDFASFLGLPAEKDAKGVNWRFDEKTASKMQQIYLWGMIRSKSNDHDIIKKAIYELQRKVGVNWQGKTLIERLWQHTTFDTNFKKTLEQFIVSQQKAKVKEEQQEQKELQQKAEDRPQKSEISSIKQIGKVDTIIESMTNDMKIKEIKIQKSEPVPI